MPDYHLIFPPFQGTPMHSVSFTANSGCKALTLAERHDRPAELWLEHEHLCTIETSAGPGSMWLISPGRGRTGLRLLDPLQDRGNPSRFLAAEGRQLSSRD